MTKRTSDEKSEIKANILKGLAHPVRIAIAEMLADDEICACEIADKFSIDRTTVSKHLSLMTRLGILKPRRDGQNILYTLNMKCLLSTLQCIDDLIERGVCCEED